MSFYAADGSINVTVVDGDTYTGVYAPDGSVNVFVTDGSEYAGFYHGCGAWNVTVDDSATTRYAPDGSINVSEAGTGLGLRVTVVSGSLAGFSPAELYFHGDANLTRGATLTGAADNRFASGFFWVETFKTDGASQEIFKTNNNRFRIVRHSSNKIQVTASGGATTFTFGSDTARTANTGLVCVMWSFDTNQTAGNKIAHLYVNGEDELEVVADASAAFTCDFTDTEWLLGSTSALGNYFSGRIKELWFQPGVFIDWSDPANRAKVRDSNGNPVDPGENGELITGSAPLVYLSARPGGTPAQAITNRGTGGGFTEGTGKIAVSNLPMIGYGDSILAGTAATPLPDNSFHQKFCRLLDPVRNFVNHGYGGQGLVYLTARIEEFAADEFAEHGSNALWLLQGGYNDVAVGSATILSRMETYVNALLAIDPNANFLIHGILNGGGIIGNTEKSGSARYDTIVAVNSSLASTYGARFFDARAYLISDGLTVMGITPTAEDLQDIADDVVPRSLRNVDPEDPDGFGIHPNDDGHEAIAIGSAAHVAANLTGWTT